MSAEHSLLEAIAHFVGMTIEVVEVEHHALEAGAKLIEERVKADLGTYQDAAGPFPAWAALAEATKEDRVRQGYTPDDPGLRSGEMRDSIGHTVHGREADIGSDDPKLVFFEEGTIKQPPRHVLGGAAFRSAPEVAELIGGELVAVLSGGGRRTAIPTE